MVPENLEEPLGFIQHEKRGKEYSWPSVTGRVSPVNTLGCVRVGNLETVAKYACKSLPHTST